MTQMASKRTNSSKMYGGCIIIIIINIIIKVNNLQDMFKYRAKDRSVIRYLRHCICPTSVEIVFCTGVAMASKKGAMNERAHEDVYVGCQKIYNSLMNKKCCSIINIFI